MNTYDAQISAAEQQSYTVRLGSENANIIKYIKPLLPVTVSLAGFLIARFAKDSPLHPEVDIPYFTHFLLLMTGISSVLFILSLIFKGFGERYRYKAPFIAGVIGALTVINILTAKTALLPVLYFPAPDRILGVLITDAGFIFTCLLHSMRLLLIGWGCGAAAGIVTGIAIGFNKHVRYWVQPLVRFMGPIPTTAWIPVVLVIFPTVISASSFLIALAVWFPTAVLTSSGIAGIKNSYFEAASTLGASARCKILRVGIPAALPSVFIGLFNGTTASFITLVTAEMLGAKYGIGWYINWQKDMMSYANVYAGLIVMSVTCYLIITLLFRLKDKKLKWQEGVIKW